MNDGEGDPPIKKRNSKKWISFSLVYLMYVLGGLLFLVVLYEPD